MSSDSPTPSGIATVLGPVTLDGEDLTRRQRSIVAALVLFGDVGVTTGQLIDAVWPCDVPTAARPSLQNQITRLRRRFGPDVIDTSADGYRLGRSRDVELFERHVGRGLAEPLAADAIVDLEHGLTYWNGLPYSVLSDHPRSDAERALLVNRHAEAVERLATCRISVGERGLAIEELTVLVEEDPFREHRWELLMTALHLDGRRAEALAAYRVAEERFRGELSTTPSADLQRLRDLIASGSELRSAATEAQPPRVAVAGPGCHQPMRRRALCGSVRRN